MFAHVNLIAVIVGTVAYMALGMFWYSPMGFGDKWAQAMNIHPSHLKPTTMHLIFSAVIALVASWSMAQLIGWVSPETLVHSLCFGFVAWLGLSAAPCYSQVIWAGQNITVFVINQSGLLVKTLVLSALFSMWH